MEVKEYILVYNDGSANELIVEVNENIKKGYMPIGGIATAVIELPNIDRNGSEYGTKKTQVFYQAMIR